MMLIQHSVKSDVCVDVISKITKLPLHLQCIAQWLMLIEPTDLGMLMGDSFLLKSSS